ncbi:MAG: dihydrodipicolinate synthase family protein [Thiothrix sp.]|nr:MAG: dihydrodipicolinate synthase family protein [Thiothrix sp.]
MSLKLLNLQGKAENYQLNGTPVVPPAQPVFNRKVLSAAHVVNDPTQAIIPAEQVAIDWESTLAYRRYLASLGLGIAEAMDTAQRGMGLDWSNALELIRLTQQEIGTVPIYHGVGTDHLPVEKVKSLDEVLAAYLLQLDAVQQVGGRAIIMASRALAAHARSAEDYIAVYEKVLAHADHPVILHWLGEMFDPSLSGYWGVKVTDPASFAVARDVCLTVMNQQPQKVAGIKISLLDKQYEIDLRRRLPKGVEMYTGDDFNYPELILGDEQGYSHALLGIFDAVAPVASAALHALNQGEIQRYQQLLGNTLELSRCIFEAPTRFYKTGVVFLAWLNGHQTHFTMLGGQQAMRSLPHLCQVFRLADQAGVLQNPALAEQRMRQLLQVYGVN